MAPLRKGHLLARVNFPPYAIHNLTERHILVAGGGGDAKCGIPNTVEIYELINNGSTCRAEPVTHYDTGSHAIMNCTVFHNGKHHVLAAGMEEMCQMYQLTYKILDKTPTPNNKSVRRRRRTNSFSSENEKDIKEEENKPKIQESTTEMGVPVVEKKRKKSDANSNSIITQVGFDVKPIQSFQTDFNKKEEPFQKVVRFTSVSNILATAGADGHVRLWKYPELTLLHDIEAHGDEVDNIDFSPSGNKIVSISRDGHGFVWNVKDGTKHCELKFLLPKKGDDKYIFRSCRYGIVEGDKSNFKLFTIVNPAVRKKTPLPCYLFKWNATKYVVEKMVSTGTDMLSVMTVSDDGRFVGLGTLSGSVDIYISFSLMKLYHVENAHNIFVTGLEFLPSNEEAQRITGDQDTSLISISVDNHIIVHHVPKPSTMGIVGILLLFMAVLFLVYVLLDYLNL
ncbi:prolactin regulatory element-binding protein-like isoform X2 [Limulus polyphemus]|uniref:Prolactin regulatory element-binding protein-like isoform X2 n=1 Tax=Limulus polyphemus TaxID=6850 RepID=A0ABM1T2I3_LIMPO|nr:prolactin regulatory element-binding protein-like isoform X2 [Limulus polyphemus]